MFKLTNGRVVNLNINKGRHPLKDLDSCKSKFQYELGQILLELFPNYTILEEFFIPQDYLYFDFMIPKLLLAFEAQGKQHNEFNVHFHKFYHNFAKSQRRDKKNKSFCTLNNIKLIEVPYSKIDIDLVKSLLDR